MKEIRITTENAGGRLDKMLGKYLDKAPKGFVYKMLRKKNIVLNQKKAAGSELLQAGDVICIYLSDETYAKFSSAKANAAKDIFGTQKLHTDTMLAPLICFEDEHLLAVNKPAGMLSQKSCVGDSSANDLVFSYLQNEDPSYTPGISNRLDRNTSGLLLAGKTPAAVRDLNKAIRERQIDKYYLCLVKGQVNESAKNEGYLVKDAASNTVKVSATDPGGASRIATAYQPLAGNQDVTLLQVELITGKSHQIRAHFAFLGHPLLGDPKYGDAQLNLKYKQMYALKRQFLHAHEVKFQKAQGVLSYLNGISVTAPLPDDLQTILKGEGLWQPGIAED